MDRLWPRMFVVAGLFNFVIAIPIIVAPRWSYDLAFVPAIGEGDAMTLRFWRDFGFAVAIIGIGYYIVARDVTANRGIVLIGILAKMFDVVVLTYRYAIDVAEPIVLLPAAIDGLFVVLFVLFLVRNKETRGAVTPRG
jgi:hypothetical protein